jgi:hypothetical protein
VLEERVVGTVSEILAAIGQANIGEMERTMDLADRRIKDAQQGSGRSRIPSLEAAREKTRKRISGASKLLIDGVLDREAYDITRAELGAELEAIDAELARLRGQERPVELLSLATVLRIVSGWSEGFATADPAAVRAMLGHLFESVEPVRLGRGVYEARLVWTPFGERLSKAAAALTGSRNLVSVDHLGRTECSTSTIRSADPVRALRAS